MESPPAQQCESPPQSSFTRRRTLIVTLCCLIGGIRVLLMGAAFPLFSNLDEQDHFDLIVKYSHAHWPRGLERFSAESARLISLYGTFEYLSKPDGFPFGEIPPPVWHLPADIRDEIVRGDVAYWTSQINHECFQPPVYYAVGGAWYAIGKWVGLDGGELLYWARWLNAPLYALLTYLAYRFARRLVIHNDFVVLGTPILLAVLPQDVFYSLNNDVLAAVTAVGAYVLLLHWYQDELPGIGFTVATATTAAAAFLCKVSNAPVIAVLLIVAAARVWRGRRRMTDFGRSAILILVALAPIGAWIIRNHLLTGDLTGAAARNRLLGMTPLPVAEYWRHPIFTPSGLARFWAEITVTFWRGEFVWLTERLATRATDIFYVASTGVFIAAFLIHAARRKLGLAGWCFGIYFFHTAWPGFLSILFDYGNCPFPSRDWPFFSSGRLMFGAAASFAVMYLIGMDVLLSAVKLRRFRWMVLALIAVAVVVAEAWISLGAFGSAFNWFHL